MEDAIMEGVADSSTAVSTPATSEVSDDSEADSIFFAPCFAAADDEDDAESCSGGGGGGCGGADEEPGGRGVRNDQYCRWMSWRSWLMEPAPAALEEGEVCDSWDDQEPATKCARDLPAMPPVAEEDKMAVEEAERSNRLFWEACLAGGY